MVLDDYNNDLPEEHDMLVKARFDSGRRQRARNIFRVVSGQRELAI